ncbi:hypothetical protein RYZ26_18245 [Terasakiella sp. A23]|uniref:hypothetical protein n=1 Tax=Terasakiella sp. FCG-A23 TaxID=3080561 RepID=UPI002952F0C1|nr:hypothetical protein [Terasakiella sp. A23]MDV7341552.1 hypothetical protein [Terasakiella sp. A23]
MVVKKKIESDIPCRHTFQSAVDLFLQLAKEQAQDGQVSVDTLDFVAQAIQSDPEVREKYCDAQIERCASHMRMSIRNAPRVNVYGRIISQPFEHLLKNDQPVMASAQLANFFHAIEVILGRAKYETFMERSLRLMENRSRDLGSKFTYMELYKDPECWNIRWDSFMALAGFFGKFTMRKDWYKRVMQSDPETPGTGMGPFPFSDFQFKSQMMCIFGDFTNFDDEEQALFEGRYSKKERKELSAFLANVASIEEEG